MSAGCRRSPIAKHNMTKAHVMPDKISLIGQRFGKVVVIEEIKRSLSQNGVLRYVCKCRCDCGIERDVCVQSLGIIKSCGCERRLHPNRLKHGHSVGRIRSKTHSAWSGMIQRCTNTHHPKYPNYGGRGIVICERWRHSFENFLADMGVKPLGKTLDRKDVNGNYEPDNCRWATPKEQANNTTHIVMVKVGSIDELISHCTNENKILLSVRSGNRLFYV
jgi:hypothetical protein